jgi:hypothetical protein
MLKKLKDRWGIDKNHQVILILIVFAITGSSIVYVRRPIFELLGVDGNTPLYFTIPLYVLVVFPTYQVLLLFYGFIFGQFKFFWNFEKKMLSRFGLK